MSVLLFKGEHNIDLDYNHKHVFKRHNILIQCHGKYTEVHKKLYFLFEIDILRNYSQKDLGVRSGDF